MCCPGHVGSPGTLCLRKEFVPPFRKLFFADEMVMKYEPLANALRKLNETNGKDIEARKEYDMHLALYQRYDWCSSWDGNKYDIVFYGVSGYTGYLMMEYLKRVPSASTSSFA